MRSSILFFVLIFTSIIGYGQSPSPTPELYSAVTLDDLIRLQKAALASDYAYRQVGYLSNNIGPRLSGSAQAERSVQYVADEMRKLGLDVRLQKIMVPHWVRGEERGELVEYDGMAPGTTQKVVLCALGGSIATPPEGITAEIVVVENFARLNALGRDKIAGKIVLFNHKFDREMQASGFGGPAYGAAVAYRVGGAIAAAKLGAVAVIVRSAGGSQNRLPHTGVMRYANDVAKIPGAAVTYEDAEMIAWLAKIGKVRMKLTLTPQTLPDAPSYNVIADLKGSEKPDEIVIVSGHLDSWDLGQGALDNGAGVAVSMAVPHLIKSLNLKPKRTIRFIAWMDEEYGGRGSEAYEKEQETNLANHFAAIEADSGASHPLGFFYAGKPEALRYFAPISNILSAHGAGLSQLQNGVGADIDRLTRKGVPSFGPWFNAQTYFNYHHSAADTFDKIDPRELAEVASVVTVLSYGLANLQQPLPR
ncbi:MAG: M20/M25/M40 family metallo-hydrolase [Pyrinomonadaceae bacterium]